MKALIGKIEMQMQAWREAKEKKRQKRHIIDEVNKVADLGVHVYKHCGLIMARSIKMLHVMTTFALVVIVFMFLPL